MNSADRMASKFYFAMLPSMSPFTRGLRAVFACVLLLLAAPALAQEAEWERLNKEADKLREQGNFDQAEKFAEDALLLVESAYGPEHFNAAGILGRLAEVYLAQGRYAQAEPLFKRSLAIREAALGPEHPDVAESLNNLAVLYKVQSRYAQAEPLSIRALEIVEKALGPDHSGLGALLNNLATHYRTLGRYAQAEPLYKRSLAIREAALGPEHPDLAPSLTNLASLYDTLGQDAQAELLYKRALTIGEQALGQVHPGVAAILGGLAGLYSGQKKYAQAESLYRRSLAILEKAFGAEHPHVAASLSGLAGLYKNQEKYAEAESLYKRSLAIYEKAFGPEHPRVAASLSGLAGLYKSQKKYAEAELLYKRSLAIYEKALGPEHPAVATNLSALAYLYIGENRLRDALDPMRQSARILGLRAKFAGGKAVPQDANAPASEKRIFASLATLIGRHSFRTGGDPSQLTAESFAVAQLARLGDTGAALAQMSARASAGSSLLSRKVREQQDAVAAWRKLDTQLIDALGKPAAQRDAGAEQALRQELADTNARIATLNDELLRDFPEYRELVSPEPLSVSEVRKLLRPDEALISYLVTGDKTETMMWLILPHREAWLFRLDLSGGPLAKQVAALREGVDLDGGLPDYPHATAHALYKSIFAPAVGLLDGIKHIMVVADGPLQSLPFGMLLTEPVAPKTEKNLPWLIRQYAFTNLPTVSSLRALRHFGKKQEASEPFLGFGDPLFKGSRDTARGLSISKIFTRGALADTREMSRMARLPETADELKAIAKTLKAPANAIRLREVATERQVKQTDLTPYRVLAFATHGLMSGDFTGLAEPALALTPPATASELDDGLLTASEVAGLKLNADWVILSACNTAAADGKPGADGFSGLAKAFFYAGSQTLLVSHWAVDSIATVALTTRMFDEAGKGVGRAEALRRSMLALVDHPTEVTLRHPAMWAPFVVVGEGGVAGGP